MLNIALEGLLLTGAFSASVCVHFTGSIPLSVLAAILSSMALAALLASITLKLRANVFITGLAANLFATGMTVILSYHLFATRGVVAVANAPRLKTLSIPVLGPVLNSVPVLGDILTGHTWYVYASWVLLFLAWAALFRTPFGFRLRSCEHRSEALVSLGLKPGAYRFAGFLISGFTCGIGGSFLSLNLGAFVPNISSGKGWIALVIIFLGNRKPRGLLIAAFVFGLAEAFSNFAQGALKVPTDFILAIPYVFTLIVMIAVSVYAKRKRRIV
jgi:simple sugar transport system permease protein